MLKMIRFLLKLLICRIGYKLLLYFYIIRIDVHFDYVTIVLEYLKK